MSGDNNPGFELLPVPSPAQMRGIAELSGYETFTLTTDAAKDQQDNAGFVFQIRKRQTHLIPAKVAEPAGVHLFDYFADPNKVFSSSLSWFSLWRKTRGMGLDALIIGPMIEEAPTLRGIKHDGTTAIFRADSSSNGWAFIHGKKKVRQIVRNAQKNVPVTFETVSGNEVISYLPKLAAMHRERWDYEGVRSAFQDPKRIEQYGYPTDRAVLHILRFGNEIAGLHYGFQWREGVLFHTPIINIKFLNLSPLTVLIYHIARWADESGIKVFDFGLGSEEYKQRFANSERKVYSTLVPLSLTGLLVAAVGAMAKLDFMVAFRARLPDIHQRITVLKRRLPGRVQCYQWSPGRYPATAPPHASLHSIDTWEAYVDHARSENRAIGREHYRRYRNGCVYISLSLNGNLAGSGWLTNPRYAATNTAPACEHQVEGVRMLFDLYDPQPAVGNDSLKIMLDMLGERWPEDRFAICSREIHRSYAQALVHAGFEVCR